MPTRRHAYVDVNPYAGAMVKRTRDPMQIALSRVEPRSSINPDASAKHDQAYMYPNGIIKRAPSVMLNGRYYTDPRGDNHRTRMDGEMQRVAQGSGAFPNGVAAGQPRRSIESNFLLTINPNRKWGTDGTGNDPNATRIFQQTLNALCENANFLTCLKVPTKTRAQPDYSAHFQQDALNFTDVIVSVDAKGTIVWRLSRAAPDSSVQTGWRHSHVAAYNRQSPGAPCAHACAMACASPSISGQRRLGNECSQSPPADQKA